MSVLRNKGSVLNWRRLFRKNHYTAIATQESASVCPLVTLAAQPGVQEQKDYPPMRPSNAEKKESKKTRETHVDEEKMSQENQKGKEYGNANPEAGMMVMRFAK